MDVVFQVCGPSHCRHQPAWRVWEMTWRPKRMHLWLIMSIYQCQQMWFVTLKCVWAHFWILRCWWVRLRIHQKNDRSALRKMKTVQEWNSVSTVTDPVLHVTQSTCKNTNAKLPGTWLKDCMHFLFHCILGVPNTFKHLGSSRMCFHELCRTTPKSRFRPLDLFPFFFSFWATHLKRS